MTGTDFSLNSTAQAESSSTLSLDSAIERAVQTLSVGGLVAFPTETVYGLGADANNPDAVRRIFAAKGRPPTHPLILHVASAALMTEYATEVPDVAWEIADHFWPGPLTLIVKRNQGVSDLITGGQDTVGLRVPSHPVARRLLEAFGRAIAAPSANRFGRISPTRAAHVVKELSTRVDQVLEGGSCTVGLESTILDLSAGRPRLLRPGAVSRDMLAEVLGERPDAPSSDTPRVPGQMASHYAPRTPMQLVSPQELVKLAEQLAPMGGLAVIARQSRPDGDCSEIRWKTMPAEQSGYARDLYDSLREIDEEGHDRLLVECPPLTPEWEAVHDRLKRAATPA